MFVRTCLCLLQSVLMITYWLYRYWPCTVLRFHVQYYYWSTHYYWKEWINLDTFSNLQGFHQSCKDPAGYPCTVRYISCTCFQCLARSSQQKWFLHVLPCICLARNGYVLQENGHISCKPCNSCKIMPILCKKYARYLAFAKCKILQDSSVWVYGTIQADK